MPIETEHRFRRLIEIGRGVLAELDLDTVLRSVAEAARELTGARYAALGVLDEDKENLDRFIHVGIDEETATGIGDLPQGRGVLGELIRHPEALRLHDVSEHPHSYGFPAGHPPMSTFLGVPIAVRGEAYGNLYITEKADGADFSEDDEDAMTILAEWAAIAVENARLYTDLASRQEKLQRALRQVETTLAITKAVGGETEIDRVLELIVKRARALVESQALAVFLIQDTELVVAAAVGRTEGILGEMRVPIAGSPVGKVLTTQRLETLDDPASDLLAATGTSVALLVPLVFRGRSVGVLAALDRLHHGPRFDGEDQRLLTSFATSAATAVATAQTIEESRLRARVDAAERERHHWAHELHDEALQQLAAIRLQLAAALRASPGTGPDPVREAAAQAVERLERELDSLSHLINELRPVSLETLGLNGAIEALAAEASERDGVAVESRLELPKGLSAETERTIYRLVQESLNNVLKHAEARFRRTDGRARQRCSHPLHQRRREGVRHERDLIRSGSARHAGARRASGRIACPRLQAGRRHDGEGARPAALHRLIGL